MCICEPGNKAHTLGGDENGDFEPRLSLLEAKAELEH